MNKRKLSWVAAAALIMPLALPFAAQSAELKIEFHEPERFSDIEPARENRERFRERTLEGFEQIFTELAETLPDDQVLNIRVTNIDLAGYVDHVQRDGGLQPMRVVRQSEAPMISFEYSLVDADGNVLQEGEERLRGRGVAEQLRRGTRAEYDHLRMEKEMIERWFKRNFDV
ncbi:MAG: DUF3016 domain-containing protein [Idiomarina sp.]|nr:DUF3016 domain-containing protein [Idiomarina sp.]